MNKTIFLTSLLLVTGTLQAGEISSEPILRPNTSMHTAPINRAAIDKNERFLVTASDDKTAKLWSLPTGKLLQTLRVPIGEGHEGKLYATAIDPKGEWIAVGGWTVGKDDAIYLFNRHNGQLLRRLSGLPNVIKHLCVSEDGSRLAATLGGSNGVHVWNTADWSLAWQDSDYDKASYGCDFAADNRLATTSDDGYIRLYNSQGHLLKKQRTSAGKRPFGIAFHPKKQQLAVGFTDNTNVVVYHAKTLEKQFTANTSALTNGDLSKVAWSADGKFLYAGGMFIEDGKKLIRWSQGGRGKPTPLTASQNTIMSLLPLQSGDLLVAAIDPTWLQLTANGKVKRQKHSLIMDNRNKLDNNFLLAKNGQQIALGLNYGGKNPIHFSIAKRQLQPLSNKQFTQLPSQGFLTANTNKKALAVSDWEDEYHPKLNGKALSLKQYEFSRSLAIAPDNGSFLLGAQWYLRRFNAQGQQDWQIATPGTAWGVNLSADGKLAVSALGDGTIRWYRYRDGQELLALFIDKNSKEWILWTPGGYYDASADGDKLIGWHLNNGVDKVPDFYPAKTLRKKFYRPQVINHILTTLDEAKAIRLANQLGEKTDAKQSIATALPPTVKILSHLDGDTFNQEKITLRVKVTRNSGTTKFKVLIDGEPVEKSRGLMPLVTRKQKREHFTVKLPKRDVTVTVIAENHLGASPPTSVRLKWAGKKPVTASGEEFTVKPKLYILAVGVSNYHHSRLNLDFPNKDAQDFVKVLKAQQGKLYRQVESKLLTDADKDDILDGLDWLRENATAKDVTMLFLSGHGANDRDNNYRFVAADSDVQKLYRTGVSYNDIKNTLVNLAGKRLAFIDTCHSGNVLGSKTKGLAQIADINGIVNDLTAAENGVVVFASSSGTQLSIEDPRWGNGAFTKAVVEGLSGKADYTKDGKITVNQLDLYISERVKTLTDNRQTPVTAKPDTLPDFPIGVVR